ncbi:helix-turn-helix transcriptional regulator [Cohnella hashimotonis]|uniref:Helix-turn-helix domain-containing protein n=1 Tax=Cohnella hashimotonis TaxID=2826895 RepID=A0ABT6TGB1_9BACL|nr:AraC family transcriptional regulator [Cohnella hashimotonis]MDI4645877.1 helix-turn-helix domain-containing protein [Cohnella hashimotonis]
MNVIATNRVKLAPGFWASMRQIGLAPQDIVHKCGLPLSIINESVVTTVQYYAIWQAYAELVGDIADGIVRLATGFETAQYPPAALSTFHARNYRDALTRMTRYKQMCPPEHLSMRETDDYGIIELEWAHAMQPGPSILVGTTLAYLLELGRRGTNLPLTALSVSFVGEMGDTEALEAFFGCQVRVGADVNRLMLRRSDLDLPFISYNEELLDILTPALDRSLTELQSNQKVSDKVKWILARCLSQGRIDILNVAQTLGLSDRTLQRRLTEEGASFKQLLTESRHEHALAFLADPSLEIKEVAFLVGFEDPNSFHRAFRAWEGTTPANWRAAQEL